MWSTAEEIISFTVAIALFRHVVDHENQNNQFSASDLAEEVNSMPFSDQADLHVDPVALQQGIMRFKKGIVKLINPDFIPMNPAENGVPTVPTLYGLDSFLTGFNLKFKIITDRLQELNARETKSRILTMRNKILNLQLKNKESIHTSLAHAMGQFHYEKGFENPEPLFISSRKSLNDCDWRMKTIHGKRLNEVIGSNYSDEEIPTVLRAALEETQKKKLKHLKDLKKPLFAGDERDDVDSAGSTLIVQMML
jgi:hypothetical protein